MRGDASGARHHELEAAGWQALASLGARRDLARPGWQRLPLAAAILGDASRRA